MPAAWQASGAEQWSSLQIYGFTALAGGGFAELVQPSSTQVAITSVTGSGTSTAIVHVAGAGSFTHADDIDALGNGALALTYDDLSTRGFSAAYASLITPPASVQASYYVGGGFAAPYTVFGIGYGLDGQGRVLVDRPIFDSGVQYLDALSVYDSTGTKLAGGLTLTSADHDVQAATTASGAIAVWSHTASASDAGDLQFTLLSGTNPGSVRDLPAQTSGVQDHPSVAVLTDGRFVVVWHDTSAQFGDTDGAILGGIYNPDGSSAGGLFQVNATAAGGQTNPHVTALRDGGFFVAFDDPANGGDVHGRVFSAAGTALGGDIAINTATAGIQSVTDAITLSDGRVLVGYSDSGSATPSKYQIGYANQTPLDGVFRFFDTSTGDHFYTTDAYEKSVIQATLPSFQYESVRWAAPEKDAGTIDVFRFYDTVSHTHLLTTDANERAVLQTRAQFTYEGVAFQAYASAPGDGHLTLERFFNTVTGQHHFSADPAETAGIKAGAAGAGWIDEGAGFTVHVPLFDMMA